MIESLTLQIDLDSLPESTLEKLRRAAVRRGKTIGTIAKDLLCAAAKTIDEASQNGTAVVETENSR